MTDPPSKLGEPAPEFDLDCYRPNQRDIGKVNPAVVKSQETWGHRFAGPVDIAFI